MNRIFLPADKKQDAHRLDHALRIARLRSQIRPLVIGVAFLLFFLEVAGVVASFPTAKRGDVDFRHLYTAGYMARTGNGRNLHDYAANEKFQNSLVGPANGTLTFNHLAYESMIYAPFTFLSYPKAYVAFFGANLIVLAGIVRMLWRYFSPLGEIWRFLPAAVVICFLPVAMALIEGQDSLILLALLGGCMIAMDGQKEFRGGVFLGLTLFKFQYALPIVFLYLVWRRWRFVMGFLAAGVGVASLSVCLTGLSGMWKYVEYILSISAHYSAAGGERYGIHPDGMANLRGLVSSIAAGPSLTVLLVTVGLSAGVMIWAGFKQASLPGALVAAILVSYHHVIADTSLLILPGGLLLAGWIQGGTRRDAQLGLLACCIIVGLPVLLFVGTPFFLVSIPLLGIFALCDGTYLSQGNGMQGSQRPQKETK